jgi:hypothetical protein
MSNTDMGQAREVFNKTSTDMLLRGIVGSMIFELETYIDTDEIHSGMQHLG